MEKKNCSRRSFLNKVGKITAVGAVITAGMVSIPKNIKAAHYVTGECTGCEACLSECPLEAITIDNGVAFIDPDTCTDCGACVDVCPVDAIDTP